MRPVRTLGVMGLSVAFVLVLVFTTVRFERRHLEDPRLASTKEVTLKVQAPPTLSLNASFSERLKKIVPQKPAYWNRRLYSSLQQPEGSQGERVWSRCELSQESLRTNVYDLNSYPTLFQAFLRGMNCRSPPLLLNQPHKCVGDNQTLVLFAIKSLPGHFLQRQAVRETWGQESDGVRTVFLLGTSPDDEPDVDRLLHFEARHYRDVLQWDFQESLFNLTLKYSVFLQWTLQFCPHASFVFSGDDDVFVNTPGLLRYLQSLKPPLAQRLYAGHILRQASPIRDPKSKYYVPHSFYDGPYPAYAGGGGYLISGSLLQPLHDAASVIPLMPIDDVYVGMCAAALDVPPENHRGFQTFDIRAGDRENLCVYKDLILIHRRSPQQTKKLWRGIHSPLLTC